MSERTVCDVQLALPDKSERVLKEFLQIPDVVEVQVNLVKRTCNVAFVDTPRNRDAFVDVMGYSWEALCLESPNAVHWRQEDA